MSFEITEREIDGVVILNLNGRFVIGEAIELFRNKLDELLKAGRTRIALDLSGTEYIDSSGMGYFVVSHTQCEKAGGSLTMFNLTQRSIDLMLLTKLSTVFNIFDNEIDAVNATYPDRKVKKFDILDFVQRQGEDAAGGE
jgi:anti-sigma B factor antagonist